MEVGPKRRVVQRVLRRCLQRVRSHGHPQDEVFGHAIDDLPDFFRECADRLDGKLPEAPPKREPDGMSGYGLWADHYDFGDNPVVAGEEAVIHDLIGDVSGLLVLDAGCGTGRHAIRLAEAGAHVVGYDPTPKMLSVAKQKAADQHLDVTLHCGDLEAVSNADSDFDLVLCCLVLSHVEDLARAIRILSDRLKPGGRLILSDFHPFFLLTGFRTSFSVEDDAFVVPNTTHLLSDYIRELRAPGIDPVDVVESGFDPAYPGIPHTLVLAGRKRI
jgi:ubiquinone biosynthesis O-methyltransferase